MMNEKKKRKKVSNDSIFSETGKEKKKKKQKQFINTFKRLVLSYRSKLNERNDSKYERNGIITLLVTALSDRTVGPSYACRANS